MPYSAGKVSLATCWQSSTISFFRDARYHGAGVLLLPYPQNQQGWTDPAEVQQGLAHPHIDSLVFLLSPSRRIALLH
ncbi:UNVERIFIED_CONTAM: hypothetical protein Slati_4232300 [Sesamum latifolium]|uniref:Uncharacterized protein n=1 Tax=Sesamum latifolium TaxID=2727402 RepID=A0AAW2TBB8_9LAMI